MSASRMNQTTRRMTAIWEGHSAHVLWWRRACSTYFVQMVALSPHSSPDSPIHDRGISGGRRASNYVMKMYSSRASWYWSKWTREMNHITRLDTNPAHMVKANNQNSRWRSFASLQFALRKALDYAPIDLYREISSSSAPKKLACRLQFSEGNGCRLIFENPSFDWGEWIMLGPSLCSFPPSQCMVPGNWTESQTSSGSPNWSTKNNEYEVLLHCFCWPVISFLELFGFDVPID